MAPSDSVRNIPKVDRILGWPEIARELAVTPRQPVIDSIRAALDELRQAIAAGKAPSINKETILPLILARLSRMSISSLRPVVNGTGVVIHTNLGRAPLASAALQRIEAIACRYSNLEIDLDSGQRGERYSHVEPLLCELTGAEAALVVNNNAAAVLLAISALAQGKEAIVSRGELVEIGGSFRVPDVMRLSGAILREVGTTNRTHLRDYRSAITDETAIIMKVHASNFAMSGFTAEVEAEGLAALGKECGIPVMADIGSGNLADFSSRTEYGEPTIAAYLKAGVDLVTCSGDKLLGGPQAGILLGRRDIIDRLRTHPLLRAVRIDKLTLAALEATLLLYRDERRALTDIPTLKMLFASPAELRAKGNRYLRRLRRQLPLSVRLSLVVGESQVGGGAMPLSKPETVLIAVDAEGWTPHGIDEAFRRAASPVVGRINKGRYLLDLRTLMDEDLPALQEAFTLLSADACAGRKTSP